MPKIFVSELHIGGSPLEGENPLPFFRNENHSVDVETFSDFPDRYKEQLGGGCGFRMLPYRRQDRYSRRRRALHLKTIVLENDFLRAEFLCDYGGRLWSLYQKKENRELLYRNPVFQPANLAIRDAWFSGGIEWNLGQYGHAFTTCSPVFFARIEGKDGVPFLRMYEYERCKGFFWHIDFHLPDASPLLYTYTQVFNPRSCESSMYYWTNIALPETKDSRVLSPAAQCIFMDPAAENGKKRFGFGSLPELPTLKGVDASFPQNSHYSNEYFFTCDTEKMPWEAVCEKNGDAFFDVSTDRLKYRKMFCWGSLAGGRRWSQFLAEENSFYFEIQSGLAPTQLHGISMPASSLWSWTQAFGSLNGLETECTHGADWEGAASYVRTRIGALISEDKLYAYHKAFTSDACTAPKKDSVLHAGSGWGALECERRAFCGEAAVPDIFLFPAETLGGEQQPYEELLKNGVFPAKKTDEIPWSFIVQDEWRVLLEKSLASNTVQWNAFLHLGVMYMESGEKDKAKNCWEQSLSCAPNAWAYRNLACLASMQNADEALSLYEKAAEAPGFYADRAIAEEYISLLVTEKKYEKVLAVYERILQNAPNSTASSLEESTRIIASRAFAYAFTGKYEQALGLLEKDFPGLREGETPLTDIWYEAAAGEYAKKQGVPLTSELRRAFAEQHEPPERLDFRMK